MTRFNNFQIKFKDPSYLTVSAALYPMIREALQYHYRLATRDFLALYFSGLPINSIKEKELILTFHQLPQRSIIEINHFSIPVFDAFEIELYRLLFKHMSEDMYILDLSNPHAVIQRIQSFRGLFNKYFESNTKFGCDLLRQLRLYALTHDYEVSGEELMSIYNYKTWIFKGERPLLDLNEAKGRFLKDKIGPRGLKIPD